MGEVNRDIVAIVDDDDAVRDSLRFLVEVAGHKVEAFSAAAEFLAADLRHIACLVLDQHMPAMTGLQLAEQLRTTNPAIPIMLITGSPSPAIVARANGLGIEIVLEKPPAEADILNFIAAHKP
ncbi:MAG: response regulator [Acetobacteraceae bacterium]|nr:response regulator [Acetobacteraceae bacterium]